MGKKIQCIGRYVMDGHVLGKGNFARVELATHGVTGCKVAIKIIDTRKIKEEYTRNNLHREARILGQLRHPNIIRLYETLKASTLYCLVLEYAGGDDLLAYIKSQKEARLLEEKARLFFRQLVSALHYLHERGVAHRDLKMENILLDEKRKHIKLIDFGLSNTYGRDELMKTHCGSLEYAAPELLAATERYGPEIDIWSIGIVLYAMVVGTLPFITHYTDQYRRQKLLQQIEKGLVETHEKEMAHLTQDCIDLLRKMLEPAPELRLPLMDIEIHPWVTNFNKMPFYPFQHLTKDKTLTSQAMEELSRMLSVKKELLESSVQESKCDDLSAMFNMLLDIKRQEKGLFDFDYTTKLDKKSDHKGSRPRKNKSQSKTKACIEMTRTSHIASINIGNENIDLVKESASKPSNSHFFPYYVLEELVQATPAILCPDMNIEPASDTEGGDQEKPTTSTSFDFMALCSAPTWLGPERRRSRRRKHTLQGAPASPVITDGHQDVLKPEHEGSCQGNLLMPNQAAAHVTALLRRNSSRRTRRTSSCGPPSRRNSARSRKHGGSESQPQSPNSPISPSAQTPTITIQTPKSSPIASRPANLKGLKECYSTALNIEQQDSCLEPKQLVHAHEHRTNVVQFSRSLNPSLSMNLLSDVFYETTSKSNLHQSFGQEETVESKIASADIQSIVRPKKYLNNGSKKDSLRGGNPDSSKPVSLLVPRCEHQTGVLKASPEIVIESMQKNTYMNLSDDEKLKQCRQNCELPRTDSEKRIEQGITEIKLQTVEDHSHTMDGSSTQLLGTAIRNVSNCGTISQELPESDASAINLRDTCKASSKIHRHFVGSLSNVLEPNSSRNLLRDADKIPLSTRKIHNTIDGFSKKERVSLLSASCALQSSDANSSEENLLLNRRRRRLKETVTSDESFVVPDLLSPSDNVCFNSFEEHRDSLSRSRASSFRSSKHGSSFRSSKHGSTQSVRFMMPSSPICQMFKSPIARIESFHSEDFEEFNTEMDVLVMSPSPSPSPNSVQTPTVPCFQYKIHSQRKKKNGKEPKSKKGTCGKNSAADAGATSGREEKSKRLGAKTGDCVFSSGSEGGSEVHLLDMEKLASKGKVHPMDKDEQDSGDFTMKGSKVQDKSKMISDLPNAQTSSKKFQNSLSKFSKSCHETEPKKSGVKTSIKRGFAHLLKKKKFNPDTSSGNNNNDVDSPSRNNRLATTRNGHARGPRSDSLHLQGTLSETQIIPETVLQNNISGNLEIRPSSAPRESPSPTRTKVYDFSIGNESSKSRTCLISWKGCSECTFSDEQSSEEGSDSNLQVDTRADIAVNTSIPMNNFQESKNYAAQNVTNL